MLKNLKNFTVRLTHETAIEARKRNYMQTPLKTRLGAVTKIRVHMNLVTLDTNQA